MLQILISLLTVMLFSTQLSASDTPKDNIHMFSQAQEGFVRHVIKVPKIDNDNDHRVELLIGKTMLADCNQHSLRAKIENVTLKGWGFKYLQVTDIHNGPSTMMACVKPKSEKFVSVYMGKETLRRYNSRLPIVAYVPKGYEVRYRIWSADQSIKKSEQR